MIFQAISHLKRYNYSNELKLYMMTLEKINFHRVCVFPYNILIVVKEDDGSDESYIYCSQTNERHPLIPGIYYFIPIGIAVEYCLLPNLTYYTFHVGLEINPGIDLFSACRQITIGNAEKWISDIDAVYREEDEFLALCSLRKLLLEFFIAHWPEQKLQGREIPGEFRELMQYIKIQSDATMAVSDLAERMNMAPEAFSRKFHHLIEMSPKEFITKCLIEKITSQLCNSNKTIKDVAQELNFSSEFYLSRFFKKAMGIPPATYKSMVRKP